MMNPVTTTKYTIRKLDLRREALLMLDKRGTLLDIARQVSNLMRGAGIPGVIIGGIAVVLHGHIRTTKDIDIFLPPPLESLAELLTANDFIFEPEKKEFIKDGVPVHLVLPDQIGKLKHATVEIDGIKTVTLIDLINMKLRSGSENLLRAQDLADVIGLIRHHQLSGDFTRHLDKDLHPVFRKLVRLIERQKSE